MIDEEWLRQVKFIMPASITLGLGDIKIDGISGLGGDNIAFSGVTQDGQELAIRVNHSRLAFHIRELPPFLTGTPMYDLNRLNQKLLRLVGNPILDVITPQYDALYEFLVKSGDYLEPDTLSDNPLYVWEAAMTDGFFTDEELPLALKFIEEHFGPLTNHPRGLTFIEQSFFISKFLVQVGYDRLVLRFTKLCRLAGFIFPVYDRESKELGGTEIQDGTFPKSVLVLVPH